jgi:methyl-accepting chemotaxis protein
MRRSVFVFAMLLLVSVALYAAASMWMALTRLDRLDGAGAAMLRAEESRTIAQGFLASAINIETATRGFVLQGAPALLTPFDDARARAPQQLDALRDHLRADPEQLSRLDRVTRELAQLITVSEFIIERRRTTSAATDETAELADRAVAATKAIRALVDEIDTAESQRLGAARAEWKSGLRDARALEIVMCALTLAVIGLAAWVLARLSRVARPADAAAIRLDPPG